MCSRQMSFRGKIILLSVAISIYYDQKLVFCDKHTKGNAHMAGKHTGYIEREKKNQIYLTLQYIDFSQGN